MNEIVLLYFGEVFGPNGISEKGNRYRDGVTNGRKISGARKIACTLLVRCFD